jgi:5-formyltetrahydrofolate cyclo-ligase
MRSKRRHLDAHSQINSARFMAKNLGRSALFQRSKHIAFYLPNDGEIDPAPLLAKALAMGKKCYLPVLSAAWHNRLWFAPYDENTDLTLNSFSIYEPACNWRQMRHPWALDLILTPLVAFDTQGNRLGMGGGFYDRTLAYLQRRQHWRKPRLIGIAHDFQKVAQLEQQAWDVLLHGVVTEQAIYQFVNNL